MCRTMDMKIIKRKMPNLLNTYLIVLPIVGFTGFLIFIVKYYDVSLALVTLAMGLLMFNLGFDVGKNISS
jgi:uncharacterized membrane protein